MRGYLFALAGALVTLAFMFELLRRRRLREKYAALWISLAVVVIVAGAFPQLLTRVAMLVGIAPPLNLVFFLGLLVLLVVPLAIVLHPRVLARLLDGGLRLVRRPPLDQHLTGAVIWRVAGLSVISNGLLGLEVWQLSVDLGGHGGSLVALCVGAYALAAAAGLVAIPLPAGAGLREAILVLVLAPEIGTPSATLVALLARLLATVADVVAAGIVALATRSPHRAGAAG